MPTRYEEAKSCLRNAPRTWLITGVAGFIGSNLLEALLKLGQRVVGLDNMSTGHPRNLEDVRLCVGKRAWTRFELIGGDTTSPEDCVAAARGVDYVLHHAALGSVSRSVSDPIGTNRANVDGFLNVLSASRDAGVARFIYASSSSVYGDHRELPKVEGRIGRPLSPYAVSKYANELYAEVFARAYGIEAIGLRYFNVFGPRQDPAGPYAAVIPRWLTSLPRGEEVHVHGDGETSRDFCYVENAVQANILAAVAGGAAVNQVYNVAFAGRTTLNELFVLLRDLVAEVEPDAARAKPIYRDFRAGDVRHSLADISKARELLGYEPAHSVRDGLAETMAWYLGGSFGLSLNRG
ncbi:MAG: NAD-dependent epimerase/dehydratase family protein [Rubrobacter sp.]|nr:NAD-dependent epimerase/dehydratase family protein [Rubrobacter sp.]